MNGSISSNGINDTNSFHDDSCNENDSIFFTDIPKFTSRVEELINCGTIFSSKEIFAAGMKEYHGALGIFRKVFIDYSELKPISVLDSRYVASVYIKALNTQNDFLNEKAIIVHCQGQTPKINTTILFPEMHDHQHHLRVMQVTEKDALSQIKSSSKIVQNREVTYSSTYDILTDLKLDTVDTRVSQEETSLCVNFYWEGSSKQIQLKPPHSAKAVLRVQVTAGEEQSALNEIYNELLALDNVANYQPTIETSMRSSMDLESMYNELATFKETVGEFSSYGNLERASEDDDNKDLEKPMSQLIKQSFQRSDYDFTDKLWLFLRDIGGLEDMKNYLDDILNDIVHGNLQPAVSPLNNTRLAKLIRKLYLEEQEELKIATKEKILEFLSTDQSIANLIVGIGFEKMKKDYFNFFLTNELTLLTSLQSLHKQQPVSGNLCPDISLLWKLHYCLEVITTPTLYLQIDKDCQRSLLSAALEYYSRNSVGTLSPIFCFSLLPVQDSSSPLFDSCETLQPRMWKQGVIKTNKCGFKESYIHRVVNEGLLSADDCDIPRGGGGDEEDFSIDFVNRKQKHTYLHEQLIILP